MAKKAPAAQRQAATPASVSKLRPGTGSKRIKTRLIVLYGLPKGRKTTAASTLPLGRTKWIASDSNTVATLRHLDRLPADEDIYEVKGLHDARALMGEMLKLAEEEGPDALGIDFLCIDSITQFVDWHQQDVASETGQTYLGDNKKENGWQKFNAEFGHFLDDIAALTKYVTVVVIGHAKEKSPMAGKSEWGGLNLPPQMALKLGRLANWVLYKTLNEVYGDDVQEDAFTKAVEVRGTKRYISSIIHTQPLDNWIASCNGRLDAQEPGDDLAALLEKDGIL